MHKEEQDGSDAWLVIHTRPKQEFRALQHLQNQSYTCYLPTVQAVKPLRGKLTACSEPLFSRYIFVRVNPSSCRITSLASTRGVSKLVSFGGRFATVPDEMIEALQKTAPVVRIPFSTGDPVRVKVGSLADLEGIYRLPRGDERAIVLINFLGRYQHISIKFEQLQRLN